MTKKKIDPKAEKTVKDIVSPVVKEWLDKTRQRDPLTRTDIKKLSTAENKIWIEMLEIHREMLTIVGLVANINQWVLELEEKIDEKD